MRVTCFWPMVSVFYAALVWCKLVPYWLACAGCTIPEPLEILFR